MPELTQVSVSDLKLDLSNYRTIPQKDELSAAQAMITIDAKHFWGLMESLIDDGFTPTENIIVLKTTDGKLNVKEGNRRTSVLKICFGLIPSSELDVPAALLSKLDGLSDQWKKQNEKIPCVVFSAAEDAAVRKIVSRVHGAVEAASRVG